MDRWEDDLEAEQQWRDAYQSNPAVKVTRLNGSNSTAKPKPKSKFALQMEQKRQQQGAKSFMVNLDASQERRQAMPIAGLMNEVQERPSASSSTFTPIAEATGFPLPKRRSPSPEASPKAGPSRLLPTQPDVLEPSSQEDYAEQNDERLAHMSSAEIAEEQKEVREMLDDKTIAFLMNRRKGKQKEAVSVAVTPNAEDTTYTVPASSGTAAFDIHGNLSSPGTSASGSNEHDHLHSEAEVYTLPALISMTRSSVPQQRSFALNLLQKIIPKHSSTPEVLALGPALAIICASLMNASHLSTRTAAVTLTATASSLPAFPASIQDLKPGIFVVLSSLLESDPQPSQIVLTALCTIMAHLDPEKIVQHLLLVERLQTLCLAAQWPNESPNPAFIDVLSLLVQHSRAAAQVVLSDLASLQVLSRYLAIPYWQLDEPSYSLGLKVAARTLDLLSLLGHYGIACQDRATLSACWAAYLSHTFDCKEETVAVSWIKLARIWMTCAINPHETEPDHAVSWSQVSEWGEKVVDLAKQDWEGEQTQAEIWKCLSVWKVGSARYNTACELEVNIAHQVKRLADDYLDGGNHRDRLIAGLVLGQAFGVNSIGQELAKAIFARQAQQMEQATAQDIALLVALLPLLHTEESMAAKLFIISVAGTLEMVAVSRIISQVLDELSPASARLPVNDILKPFLASAAPSSPSYILKPSEISRIATLNSSREEPKPVWPLSTPLYELLHSVESRVLRALPDNWNFGEVEIVVAGLVLLMYSIDKLQAAGKTDSFYLKALPTATQVQVQLMNIFLLEQVDARMVTSSEAVFRDPQITHLATQILDLSPSLPQPSLVDPQFYQLYTDFLGLYDSMSLGHPVFSALLLPPALNIKDYPVDFRRLLFVDYGHVLRTIESPLPAGFSLKDTPTEDSDTLLGSYLAAMVQSKITEEKNPALYRFCAYHLKGAAQSNDTWANTIKSELGPNVWQKIQSMQF